MKIWNQKPAQTLGPWIRACSICRLNAPPVRWLCPHCLKKLESFYLLPQDMLRGQGDLKHVRLLDWRDENDNFIRLLLNSLKKGGPNLIFNKVMGDFLRRFIQVQTLSLNAVIVPAPPSALSHFQDHAFCLASAFSHLSGLELVRPLFRYSFSSENHRQKSKNKKDRKRIQLQIKDTSLIKDRPCIFIDDVLTTGATAQAAYRALNKPKDFTVFTLVWRRNFFE